MLLIETGLSDGSIVNESTRNQFWQSLHNPQWLRTFQWHECVESTNTLARNFATENNSELPALFVAEQQTQGRGRGNHSWWSPRGCLMLTLAISSELLPPRRSDWNQLALIVGVALGEAVEASFPSLRSQLKWPNDLYLNGRKAAGILIESFAVNRDESIFLIGMGVNIDIDWETAPEELALRATCLSTELNVRLMPVDILRPLVDTLSQHLESWRHGRLHWHDYWSRRCYLSGRTIAVKSPPGWATENTIGRCEGVTAEGQLLIRTEQGNIARISVGEVNILS